MEKLKQHRYIISLVIIILAIGLAFWIIRVKNAKSCTIKGNVSSSGEKIFHVVGCGSYNKTVIDESKEERWFCSEQEAVSAGWRKASNCN